MSDPSTNRRHLLKSCFTSGERILITHIDRINRLLEQIRPTLFELGPEQKLPQSELMEQVQEQMHSSFEERNSTGKPKVINAGYFCVVFHISIAFYRSILNANFASAI